MRGARALGALLLGTMVVACDVAEADGGRVVLRDSAGIVIAENSAPVWRESEGWRLSAKPLLEVGAAEGPEAYLLSGVNDARRFADGGIVIANQGSAELRLYDPRGRHLLSIGREGEGPGEFGYIDWLEILPGDSILVNDSRLARGQLFMRNGKLIRSLMVNPADRGWLQGVLGNGNLLSRRAIRPPEEVPEGVHSIGIASLLLSPLGDSLAIFGVQKSAEEVWTEIGGMAFSAVVQFGRTSMAVARGDRAYLGDSGTYEIDVYSADAKLERIIRRLGPLRPYPAAVVDSLRRAGMSRARSGQALEMTRRITELMPVPETLPAYRSLLPDDVGNLWVEEYPVPPEPANRWTIFDPEGRMLGDIELPTRFVPKHIGDDFILGVWRDEMEVERVRLFGLVKE